MKRHHFHLLAAMLLAAAGCAVGFSGQWVGAAFLVAGALVATVHWKWTRAGFDQ
jgi:hypothetical protein